MTSFSHIFASFSYTQNVHKGGEGGGTSRQEQQGQLCPVSSMQDLPAAGDLGSYKDKVQELVMGRAKEPGVRNRISHQNPEDKL